VLQANADKIRVFVNENDVLVISEDVRWLTSLLGKQRITFDPGSVVRGRKLIAGVLVLAAACLAIGCAVPGRGPGVLRSPLEQVLLSQAIKRGAETATVGLPEGTRVVLDSSGLSEDHRFVADVMVGWLGRQGLVIRQQEDEARYRLRMIVESVGNDQNINFFGILASRLLWVPIVLPEIALYKKNRQAGFARLYFDIFDAADGHYVRSTSPVEGEFHQTRYTLFMVFKWRKGDEPSSPPADFERIDEENL
jgi:hypothetical protein